MKVNVAHLLHNAGELAQARCKSGGYRHALQELSRNLLELRDRTRAGDMMALDDFFAIYTFGEAQPHEQQPGPDQATVRDLPRGGMGL